MKQHLNTLYVTTQGAYLSKDGDAVVVRVENERRLRVPLHHLGSIVCFGRITCSPWLMAKCAEVGMSISFLTEHGRFLARVEGPIRGNVLLRREQYRRADAMEAAAAIARNIITAKIANARNVLLRGIRDYPESPGRTKLEAASARLGWSLSQVRIESDLDTIRGIEGEAASTYFEVFDHLITANRDAFTFRARSRRPPLDPINALLSFLYTLLMHDARSACEAVGLDPAVGFLHRDRPGRHGLALDLMEEFRPVLADRLALSLTNRQQVRPEGFRTMESGGVVMDDTTRKTVLIAYQKRKQAEVTHPFLGEKTSVGLLIQLQARLLARHLRGDLDAYPAFLWR